MTDPFALNPYDANIVRLMNRLDTLSKRVRDLENIDIGIQALSVYNYAAQYLSFALGWIDLTYDSQYVVDPQFSHVAGTAIVTFNIAMKVCVGYRLSISVNDNFTGIPVRYTTRLTLDGVPVPGSLSVNSVSIVDPIIGAEDISICVDGIVISVAAGQQLVCQIQMIGTGSDYSYTWDETSGLYIIRLR